MRQRYVSPFDRLVNELTKLARNDELPDMPDQDLKRAIDILNVSDETRESVTHIVNLMEEALYGEMMDILGSELDKLRQLGYHVILENGRRHLGQSSVVIFTVKGAIES